MASVKTLLYINKQYKDGTYPIIVQVISNRKIFKKVFGSATVEQWDDVNKKLFPKKHKNWKMINMGLTEEVARIERIIFEAYGRDIGNPFVEVADAELETGPMTYWQIADEYLEKIRAQSGWSFLTFSGIINKFKKAINKPNLLMNELDEKIVQKYVKHMQSLGNASTTMKNNLKVLRFVSNYGKKMKYGVPHEALFDFKLPPTNKSYKIKLTEEELKALADVPLTPRTKLAESRDAFLLSVYLRGVRISDIILLKESYINNGRIKYQSRKNDKAFDIKLVPQAIEIIDRYKTGSEFLFSFFQWKPNKALTAQENNIAMVTHIKSATAYINKNLRIAAERAKIKKPVSSHIARHTFAKMAIDKIKDTNITMDLLGHSSLKVHEDYIREISQSEKLDNAANDIFSL